MARTAHVSRHGASTLELIELVYECATDPDRWPAFLERLSGATSSLAVALVVHDVDSGCGATTWAHGVDPSTIAQYAAWAPQNVFIQAARHLLRPGVVLNAEAVLPDRDAMRSSFFEGYLRPAGFLHHVAAVVFQEGPVSVHLSAVREIGRPSHADSEVRLVRSLMPHLQRATLINRRLAGASLVGDAFGDVLDRLAVGVAVLDRRGRALFVNRSAHAVFDRADGLALRRDCIEAIHPGDGRELRAALSAACSGRTLLDAGAPGSLLVRRPSGARPYTVVASPLRDARSGFAEPAAIVFLIDGESSTKASESVLQRLFRLTPAEARLAVRLLHGASLSDAAEELAITVQTARWRLKQVFAKTDVHTQTQLVRTLLVAMAVSAERASRAKDAAQRPRQRRH